MMVLAIVQRRFTNILGESASPVEAYVLPAYLNGAETVICKTREDNAPFCAVNYDR